MGSSTEQAKAKVSEWLEKHRHAVLYDEESSTLVDVASGKAVHLPWYDLKACDEKAHPETRDTYIVLLFDNGNQIALVDPGGIAFSPSDANTGPLRDLPSGVCLQDFPILKQRLYRKNDTLRPTGSLKHRSKAVGLSKAKELGFHTAAVISTGNAAASVAAYAAAAGLKRGGLLPAGASPPQGV